MMHNTIKKIMAIVILPFFVIACGEKNEKIEKDKFLFGTYIKIVVYDNDRKKAEKAINLALLEIERIDNKFNSKVKGSIIDNLNSGAKFVELDDEGVYLFENIKKVYDISEKKYDVTVGTLLDIWNFGEIEQPKIPTPTELKKGLEKIGFSKVKISKNKMSLMEKGIKIDTGSFLKGYAISQAKKILINNGIKSAFISSVSSISTIGEKPNNSFWKIGLENPENPRKILGVVELKDIALGVSGDYQTYIVVNGKKYHHILNNKTGYPVEDKKMVVVLSKNAFLADMYSTAFFTMDIDKVLNFAKKNNIEVLIVKKNLEIVKSDGFNVNLNR